MTESGTEPRTLCAHERKLIGENIKTVQFGWCLGVPLVDLLSCDLWEVRSRPDTRIARTLFAIEGGFMILLHAFIKKQQKTPKPDLDLAKERLKQLGRRK
ncbi:type II toxin-antitoxin system RelE/ParE family toxin [Propionivibrio sp.]|uniref:type II toxin-antitoxin system RelE/ParE family toxin n=1 Tax=Propionivibrio sp. TaxID=2212460 RepID=UPI0026134725|nr:type II toxin-antitoxin system RelE/ParE family toxin [Propionivibrio sp.]